VSEEGGECPVFIATAPCRRAPAVGVWQSSVSGRCRLSNLILPSAKYPFNNFIYDDDNNSPVYRLFLCFIAVATRLIFYFVPQPPWPVYYATRLPLQGGSKSKLFILSECVYKTEKIGGT